MSEPKQVLVVNKELNMPVGKLAAQCAHMSEAFLTHDYFIGNKVFEKSVNGNYIMKIEVSQAEMEWISRSFAKVVLAAKNENDLLKLERKAIEYGFREGRDYFKIIDEGRTVFNGVPTFTGIGFRPMYPEEIDPITKRYRLY